MWRSKEWSIQSFYLSTKWNNIFSGFEWIVMTFGCGMRAGVCVYIFLFYAHIHLARKTISRSERICGIRFFVKLSIRRSSGFAAWFMAPSTFQLPYLLLQALAPDTSKWHALSHKSYNNFYFAVQINTLSMLSNCNENNIHFFFLPIPFPLVYLFSLFCQHDIYLRRVNGFLCNESTENRKSNSNSANAKLFTHNSMYVACVFWSLAFALTHRIKSRMRRNALDYLTNGAKCKINSIWKALKSLVDRKYSFEFIVSSHQSCVHI